MMPVASFYEDMTWRFDLELAFPAKRLFGANKGWTP